MELLSARPLSGAPTRPARTAAIAVVLLVVTGCGGASSPTGSNAGSARGGSGSGSRTASGAPRLVERAVWSHPSEGYRLHVTPTRAGRNRAATRSGDALAQAIGQAGPPPLTLTTEVRGSLLSQLRCHAVFARTKPRWNLEAWRPDVGYLATVAAACNPDR